MVDLLQEEWEVDGVAAVFSKTTKDDEGYSLRICDLDNGCWEADVDMDDICAFSRLIAAAPAMYRLFKKMEYSGEGRVKEINALLKTIDEDR